jgi:hypothetical protein
MALYDKHMFPGEFGSLERFLLLMYVFVIVVWGTGNSATCAVNKNTQHFPKRLMKYSDTVCTCSVVQVIC